MVDVFGKPLRDRYYTFHIICILRLNCIEYLTNILVLYLKKNICMHVNGSRTDKDLDMRVFQKHFLWTMDGPDSSYSCLLIHICWKVESEARMEPPIHTEYFLSEGAMILIFIVGGARFETSFCKRSAMPGNMVEHTQMYSSAITEPAACSTAPIKGEKTKTVTTRQQCYFVRLLLRHKLFTESLRDCTRHSNQNCDGDHWVHFTARWSWSVLQRNGWGCLQQTPKHVTGCRRVSFTPTHVHTVTCSSLLAWRDRLSLKLTSCLMINGGS